MKIQYKNVPKPLRFIISLLWKFSICLSSPVWFPAMIAVWFVIKVAVGVRDFATGVWERA